MSEPSADNRQPTTLMISIVTPSRNQAAFLDDAILSVLSQDYPNLEYVVVDGASTDASAAIIRKHADRLTYWVTEPDGGQYDAINKGFAKTTGEIMAWLNADDKYAPWTFSVVSEIFAAFPEVQWLTSVFPVHWDEGGRAVNCGYARDGYSRSGFYRGDHCPGFSRYGRGFIQQESTFWRRSLWESAGGYVDASLHFAADMDLWARFYKSADLYGVKTILGGFRVHPGQKTANGHAEYLKEAKQTLTLHGGRPYSAAGSLFHALGAILHRRLSVPLKLAYPQKIIEYSGREGKWKNSEF